MSAYGAGVQPESHYVKLSTMILRRSLTVFLLALSSCGDAAHLRKQQHDQRELATYYHTLSTSTLGGPNPDAAMGNPLKGLVESPIYTWPPYKPDLPVAVEFYYIGTFIQKCEFYRLPIVVSLLDIGRQVSTK
jgi:hypothetical protein